MSTVRLIALLPASLVLAACSGGAKLACGYESSYTEATSAATLRIPDDLSIPDESESLSIPGAAATAASEGPETVCLEESPAFSLPPQPEVQ